MKKIKTIVSVLVVICMAATIVNCSYAKPVSKKPDSDAAFNGYTLKSSYLKNPDSMIGVADKSASFWTKALDSKNGGFYTYVNNDGSIDQSKTYKIAFIQSRNAYAFARAYQLTGKKEYLNYARNALDFMYKNAWDQKNGGWNQEMNQDGSLVTQPCEGMDWNSVKWSFNQLYALCGISAMVDATRGKTDTDWLNKSYNSVNKSMWDSRKGSEGYYDMAGADWNGASGKSLGTTMDAFTTHAEAMYFINGDAASKQRVLTLADSLSNIAKSTAQTKFGVIENYDNDWKPAGEQPPSTTSGNILKPAWALARAYLIDPKPEYLAGAKALISEVQKSGAYDSKNGGFYTTLDPNTGKTTDNMKTWWIQEEAFNSGIANYYLTKDVSFLKMADESLDFYMTHMNDPKYGDAYGDTKADGSEPTQEKGTYWKDGFHSVEFCYYTYLYGNLMLHEKPVSLYYNIEATNSARNIKLTPVMLGKAKLVIDSVTLDGKKYKDFDGKNSTLNIPAKTGGEFKVTFKVQK